MLAKPSTAKKEAGMQESSAELLRRLNEELNAAVAAVEQLVDGEGVLMVGRGGALACNIRMCLCCLNVQSGPLRMSSDSFLHRIAGLCALIWCGLKRSDSSIRWNTLATRTFCFQWCRVKT